MRIRLLYNDDLHIQIHRYIMPCTCRNIISNPFSHFFTMKRGIVSIYDSLNQYRISLEQNKDLIRGLMNLDPLNIIKTMTGNMIQLRHLPSFSYQERIISLTFMKIAFYHFPILLKSPIAL